MRPIITVEHLRKVYRVGNEKVVALNDIELEIGKGRDVLYCGRLWLGKIYAFEPACRAGKTHKGPGADWQARDFCHDRGRGWPCSASSTWALFFKATTCCPA